MTFEDFVKLGTRLLVALVPTVSLVMLLYTRWALQQRESVIVAEARRETEAYATALALAVEHAFEDLGAGGIQGIIDEISKQPKIYGVLIYGLDGKPLLVSAPLEAPAPAPSEDVRRALEQGETVTADREIGGQRVLSVLRPIRDPRSRIRGVLEVAQPLDMIEAEQSRIQQRYVLNTLTLIAALAAITLWLVRRLVGRPVARFVSAVRDVGRGEFMHRLPEVGRGEIGELAAEFNLMAARLEDARVQLVRQADERVGLERKLRQSEKMAVVGKLAAGLAHEIAAPLNVISGRAEMLLKSGGHSAEAARQLHIIVRQIGRITTIVRNLLDFARRQEPRCRKVDLAGIVDGAVDFLETELASNRITVLRRDPRPCWVWADPDQLHQVFVNLLLNAAQALETSDGERRITVRVGGDGSDRSGTSLIRLEVTDSGPGIPEAARGQIFEPFFTTKPRGTGLGLVVARNIVEDHGGSLEAAANAPGSGAVFRITLPTAPLDGSRD